MIKIIIEKYDKKIYNKYLKSFKDIQKNCHIICLVQPNYLIVCHLMLR